MSQDVPASLVDLGPGLALLVSPTGFAGPQPLTNAKWGALLDDWTSILLLESSWRLVSRENMDGHVFRSVIFPSQVRVLEAMPNGHCLLSDLLNPGVADLK